MSDILQTARFDAGVDTKDGREQFSFVKTAGGFIGNREYKEGFDKFEADCPCADQYLWRALSAIGDQTGRVLYENVKNYIDYVTNIDLCKVQALRSMIKMYGLEYRVFDRLDMLPAEILDLLNIFSINSRYIVYGGKILQEYRDRLSAEGVNAIYNYYGIGDIAYDDSQISDAHIVSSVIDYRYPVGGRYYEFVKNSFQEVLSGFLSIPYEKGQTPIYKRKDEYGIYDDENFVHNRRLKYTDPLVRPDNEDFDLEKDINTPYGRRQFKILNGIPLQFDESAALDRIESGEDPESMYEGAKAELIGIEREYRKRQVPGTGLTGRYAFYKKQRVLEYANFVINKYYSDHKYENLIVYPCDRNYFELSSETYAANDTQQIYANTGIPLISSDESDGEYVLNDDMIGYVAMALADTAFYIARLREKIKLQTRKNYMKGTYDLMLYVINEFLVDYSRMNPIFRSNDSVSALVNGRISSYTVSELLRPIYEDLSSHDIESLTAIEYFDSTEYYNISAGTELYSDPNVKGTNERFWVNPAGESLMEHDGIDADFDIASISSFYMDTLGIRDSYISDETSLGAFLDAVFSLGAVDSFVHSEKRSMDGKSSSTPIEMFGARVKDGKEYSNLMYRSYLSLKDAWSVYMSYLSSVDYEYQTSDCVSAQALSAIDYIRQLALARELSSVSSVYDAYIDRVNALSVGIEQGVDAYNNLISGEYSYYFRPALGYKYCFENGNIGDLDSYKHDYYVSSEWDTGLEYWYDMLQQAQKYSSGRDREETGSPSLPRITNWAVRDTVEHFREKFTEISDDYVKITTNQAVLSIGITGDDKHDWTTEYGYVDISAVSLEAELKYGYDFMQTQIDQRRQFILDTFNNIKQQAIDLRTLAQNIKSSFESTLASYDDDRGTNHLGSTTIYCVSENKDPDNTGWNRLTSLTGEHDIVIKEKIGDKIWYYYEKDSGDYGAKTFTITKYKEDDKLNDRCIAIKAYMDAPTSYIPGGQYNYSMRNEGVYASIQQIQNDWVNLSDTVNKLIHTLAGIGISFNRDNNDEIDVVIDKLIACINDNLSETEIENDTRIQAYKKFLKAIVQLSSMYIPVKYEYDQMFNDRKQHSYFSEFTRDTELTMAALDSLSSYSVEKDTGNREAILQQIAQMLQDYQDRTAEYRTIAEDLAGEYMLPMAFQPYQGYIEEMAQMMYDALTADVQEKTALAHQRAQDEYDMKLAPAANSLIRNVSPYGSSMYRLPAAVGKRLKELYYLDDPEYIRQKELFLTYGGRSFCYYPYYNFKNVVHSSYQVHPFLWNFIRKEQAYGIAQNTFFSVNVDELEDQNIASSWRKYFGEYGESKYADLSLPRYPDYSGYQSRYERSGHVAEGTQFVSEVVDYDGAFYPPAVEWIRANGLSKAVNSVRDAAYDKDMSGKICKAIMELDEFSWDPIRDNILQPIAERYKTAASYQALKNQIYWYFNPNNANRPPLSDVTAYDLCKAAERALSGGESDTFYGRFCRQLRLDSRDMAQSRLYMANQMESYWPRISEITQDAPLQEAYDIYRYGIDSQGNMYCLYKKYDADAAVSAIPYGGLSYRYRQNTPGELWIRMKNHPLAFPAFSGRYPNVYMKDQKRHMAFVNLFDLYERDTHGNISCEEPKGNAVQKYDIGPISEAKTSCIYDFEFTKNRQDITFVTKMFGISRLSAPDYQESEYRYYAYTLSDDSPDVQCYQNSWLVHCRPVQDTLTAGDFAGRNLLRLYTPNPAAETDYFQSGDNYSVISRLSSTQCLSGEGVTLYQYIGSYLRGDSSIYHAYVKKHIYYDELSSVVKDVLPDCPVKIFPVINGKYQDINDISGNLIQSDLSAVGSDVCMAYDEQNGIVNFAAQTVIPADTAIYAGNGEMTLSANALGPTIQDPLNGDMNSHDIFDTNVTLFRKRVISKKLYDAVAADSVYTFNTNADMSYFPQYPGERGIRRYWKYDERYGYYGVELLGVAKDISEQISYINTDPDPYLDADAILSDFAHARVYQDYAGYVDETLKTVGNYLIGGNSPVYSQYYYPNPNRPQTVVRDGDAYIWQISLNGIYGNFDLAKALKIKILAFSRKCYGKNPYLFSDISALVGDEWIDLNYDPDPAQIGEYSVISASDYVFGNSSRVIVQSTLDGVGEAGVSDSNNIRNVKSLKARLRVSERDGFATLEFRFGLDDLSMFDYTYVPAKELQVALLDVKNLDIFNYFHYLDAYGALRVIDNFKTMEEFNNSLIKRGDGWTIYYSGHRFTDDELLNRLKSYYEYKGRMVPLSDVDLSQYDSLSDVYILQGDARLSFKLDEGFRYELDHPGYFYPTLNAKFPMNLAQYAYRTTSFRENAAQDSFVDIFDQRNVFMMDMEDPEAALEAIGRVDIPIRLNDQECVFAYEDYMDSSEDVDGALNCDLYDISDPRVLRFVQFENENVGVTAADAAAQRPISVPDELVQNVSMKEALQNIAVESGVSPLGSEDGRSEYVQESMGFTVDGGSIDVDLMAEILRIYVNYRKYGDAGDEKIELYFNYMNYLDSPYLRMENNRTYIDIIDNTYLSLKQDEDGVLDLVAQFRYYKGSALYGYKNVKMASYQIHNVSDDKPKFLIKRIDGIARDAGSNKQVTPHVHARVCDTVIDLQESAAAGSSRIDFKVTAAFEADQPMKQIELYIDYPFDFMEFIGASSAGQQVSGTGWTLRCEQPGYAKLTFTGAASAVDLPARTVSTKNELASQGPQSVIAYIDQYTAVGQNGLPADVNTEYGKMIVRTEPITQRLTDVLLTAPENGGQLSVFNSEQSLQSIKALVLKQ